MKTPEEQYLELCQRIIDEGVWIKNERTGKNVLTVIDASMEYDCSDGMLPVLTTKETAWKPAVAEMWGYLRGYNNAAQFRALGTKTWDANANAERWQQSIHCNGPDDMGYCYGAVGSRFKGDTYNHRYTVNPSQLVHNQWTKVVKHLTAGIDDRDETVTFRHPGTEHKACLRACMHTHTFSILDDTLYLTSYQRSADMPLGVPFNMIQVAWLLMIMSRITGLKPGKAFHKIVNAHIYENQMKDMLVQLKRKPYLSPRLLIAPYITGWSNLMDEKFNLTEMELFGYRHHEKIKYPFSV